MKLEPREVGERRLAKVSKPQAVTLNHDLPLGLVSAHSPLESFPGCPLPGPGVVSSQWWTGHSYLLTDIGTLLEQVSGFACSQMYVPAHHEKTTWLSSRPLSLTRQRWKGGLSSLKEPPEGTSRSCVTHDTATQGHAPLRRRGTAKAHTKCASGMELQRCRCDLCIRAG